VAEIAVVRCRRCRRIASFFEKFLNVAGNPLKTTACGNGRAAGCDSLGGPRLPAGHAAGG
jgi:hypothetical protein